VHTGDFFLAALRTRRILDYAAFGYDNK
jgi:hypothetical protein